MGPVARQTPYGREYYFAIRSLMYGVKSLQRRWSALPFTKSRKTPNCSHFSSLPPVYQTDYRWEQRKEQEERQMSATPIYEGIYTPLDRIY